MSDNQIGDCHTCATRLARRDYLKATGATIAGAALGTGMARGADFETITVSSGDTHSISLSSGDTYENKLIDVTADGASVSITAHGDGWVIRNVGIKGPINVESPKKIFRPSVPDGGSALVENFYLGDGTTRSDATRLGGVWVNANAPHEGELIMRRVNISGWADNGMYGSGPALQIGSRSGSVKIEQSYAENNNISNFRIGGDGSYVKNSTIVSDSPVSPVPNGTNSRGIWCKDYGDMLIENCNISMTGPHATHAVIANKGASATVRNCRVDGPLTGDVTSENVTEGASTEPPEGAPMSAEQAASGGGSSGGNFGGGVPNTGGTSGGSSSQPDTNLSGGKYPQVIMIGDTSTGLWGTAAEYSFTVDGEVKKSTALDGVIDEADTINDDGTVEGTIEGSPDVYRFNGTITEFEMDGQAPVYLNHQIVSADDVVAQSGVPDLPNSVTIESDGTGIARYTMTVDGTIEPGGNAYEDTVAGGRAEGHLGPDRGTDTFYFEGDLTGFELNGPATVFLNGDEIDPDKITNADLNSRTNKLIITNPDGETEFSFLVDGTVDQTDESTLFEDSSTPETAPDSTGNTSSPDSIYTNVSTETNNTEGGSTHTEISSETKMTNGEASGDVDVNTSGNGSTDMDMDTNIPDENFDGPTTDGNTTASDGESTAPNGSDTTEGDVPAGLPTSAKQETDEGMKVTGSVGGGKIVFEYTGKLSDFSYTGNASVAVKFE